jgi:hypothetical protein
MSTKSRLGNGPAYQYPRSAFTMSWVGSVREYITAQVLASSGRPRVEAMVLVSALVGLSSSFCFLIGGCIGGCIGGTSGLMIHDG